MREAEGAPLPVSAWLPDGARFVGSAPTMPPGWRPGDAPTEEDLAVCVACGLCLPHCPTYALTGEESASPRGRIAAMRQVAAGRAEVGPTFARFMDLCLACRACEDVCPSQVPFGRLMEGSRSQIEPLRSRRERLLRWAGLEVILPRGWLTSLAAWLRPVALPFVSRRTRALIPRATLGGRVPRVTEPVGAPRGTIALLTGCVQDRWYRQVNRATVRVLARNGWRVLAPRGQRCCGALHAHHGHLDTARELGRRNVRAFAEADVVVVGAAGCGAHLRELGDLLPDEGARTFASKVHDLIAFLHAEGIRPPSANPGVERVAYHDACHALRVQGIREEPRALLRSIPGLEVVEIADGDRCCGAAGLYAVTEPEMADELQRRKVGAIVSTGAGVVASANPGCTMQLVAGLRAIGADVEVLHPVEILDRAYAAEGPATGDLPAEGSTRG
jgi:glycolate oxidase iron-sulfur subunit